MGTTAAVLITAVIGGCSADAQAVEAEGTQNTAAPNESTTGEQVRDKPLDDAAPCVGFGDVMTILDNADLALDEGRMETQEHQGWYRLATRVLDLLPSDGDSTVARAIAELQAIAPAIPAGGGEEPTSVRSPEWITAEQGLSLACDELGVPLTISVFTGG
ncbi:hypothetical protein [Pseudactinotalea sp. HY158]|uniref:hypothetical protein n=1 Tax=Pseudactinotalea sp. HY158 TaxID=2654547 RepID=UPI00129C6334|nr:hypothetical protein [Pseudactinotalea sp. HY158]QGH68188.1 hypothetical protein GCE65_00630 [Pseudactinotalea sp. HY158]